MAPSARLRPDADRAYAVHLPWRSNDVGRRARTSRSGHGEQLRVVARRSRTVVKGRRGKRSKDGTPREAVDHRASSSRAPNAPNAASPPVHLGSGASVSRPSTFFPSALSTCSRPSRVRERSLLPAPSSPAFSTPAPRRLPTRTVSVRRSNPRTGSYSRRGCAVGAFQSALPPRIPARFGMVRTFGGSLKLMRRALPPPR